MNSFWTQNPGSFRDKSGYVFQRNGEICRTVDKSFQEHFDFFISSGLKDELINQNLIIPFAIEEPPSDLTGPGLYKILRPEKIPFLSYPYEWTFSQIKDSALLTLKIQKIAMDHGMTLKDASAFNVQFHRNRPVHIDSLSFEKFDLKSPWPAYHQFCTHFLAPLALASYVDLGLVQLFKNNLNGIPLPLASRLLPVRSWLSLPILLHIHFPAKAIKYSRRASSLFRDSGAMTPHNLYGLVDSLENGIRKLTWRESDEDWSQYEGRNQYSEEGFEKKQSLVEKIILKLNPKSIWDLGANRGIYSRLCKSTTIPIMAMDNCASSLEELYLAQKKSPQGQILPLYMDLTNPSSCLGWSNAERLSLFQRGPADLILCLAFIHHLSIQHTIPFRQIAELFHRNCQWLLIEFVAREYPRVKTMMAGREGIFDEYHKDHFIKIFGGFFEIRESFDLGSPFRTLYLLKSLKGHSTQHQL